MRTIWRQVREGSLEESKALGPFSRFISGIAFFFLVSTFLFIFIFLFYLRFSRILGKFSTPQNFSDPDPKILKGGPFAFDLKSMKMVPSGSNQVFMF